MSFLKRIMIADRCRSRVSDEPWGRGGLRSRLLCVGSRPGAQSSPERRSRRQHHSLAGWRRLGLSENPSGPQVRLSHTTADSLQSAPAVLACHSDGRFLCSFAVGCHQLCRGAPSNPFLRRKEVTSISVHPSGRLALSTSRDGTLRLWNLVKGKSAHSLKLGEAAEQVAFSPSGNHFALVLGPEVCLLSPYTKHTVWQDRRGQVSSFKEGRNRSCSKSSAEAMRGFL